MDYTHIVSQIIKRHFLGQKILTLIPIQELWSGYGKLLRVKTEESQFIVKLISNGHEMKHPRGWSSDLAHKRKLKSYTVEMNFYKLYKKHLIDSVTPKFTASYHEDKFSYLILEDLETKHFYSKTKIDDDEVSNCLKWLARFHMHYFNHSPLNLWECGTYWHLETRPHEYKNINVKKLKEYAKNVDQILKESKYQTIVHGDAKLANFLFSKDSVGALDFQYCGGGVGIKDVAYFLSSVYNEKELFNKADEALKVYFLELKKHGATSEHINEWRTLYPYAWFDFYRFLSGWSPDHYKINKYTLRMMNEVLNAFK